MTNYIPFVAVIFMILMDVGTGLSFALLNKEFKSSVMRKGAMHKFGEICAITVLYGFEYLLPLIGIATDLHLVSIGCTYIVIMEIGSIFENINKLNPEMTSLFKGILEQIKNSKGE